MLSGGSSSYSSYSVQGSRTRPTTQGEKCAGTCTPSTTEINPGTLPSSSEFRSGYEEYKGGIIGGVDADEVWDKIGGETGPFFRGKGADAQTCSVRVSCALTAAGTPIPRSNSTNRIVGGDNNGTALLLRARDMHSYLSSIRPPDLTGVSALDARDLLQPGQVGIYARGGHTGMIAEGYYDGFTATPGDVWLLSPD